ncbi:MAG: outer membrane protein assembly factor BamE [Alphaproteobacteria bacterium]|nr:outer membrane protein assembly factor BamE [Alphaproteobacteria bacterium]MDA7983056.1 outer membrane protein assembly factor BamE [Alphaproteobacteria bacterium]MDA7984576.1 outer membrane protein assembly factor BamE [Alphaproteobacteria bacterium]MDA7987269.1 outer membrane protein assembly factor BamE [Alphaproteobacteria bacterium]MDA7988977.1 outer membrane protein assembly factor BamE [Alphaproteobacteria bacterium]
MRGCFCHFSFGAVLGVLVLLAGCADRLAVRGNLIDEEKLTQIRPGDLTSGTVREILGTPSTRRALLGDDEGETWIYIGERTSQRTYKDTEVLERQILVLHFDTDGFLRDSEVLALADGRAVVPRALTTPTPGRQFTVWQQFLGNVGRFNTPQGAPGSP